MKNRSGRLRRNLDILAWNTFFAELRLYYPVAVLAFDAVSGSFTSAMSVFAVMSVSQALFEIPTGIFSDKIGRRMTLIVGALAEVIGAACIALAFSVPHGILMLYAAGFFIGLGNAMFSGNNEALLYETLSYYRCTHENAKMLGRISSMGQLGLATSGVLAGLLLLAGFSYQHLMMLSFFPVFVSFVLTLFIVDPPIHKARQVQTLAHMKDAFSLILQNPRLRWLAIASSIKNGLGYGAHYFMPGFIAAVWPAWLTSLFSTAQNGFGAICFWIAGRVTKRFGLMQSLFGATVYSYLACGIAFITANIFSPLLLLTTQFSYAIALTSDTALKQENFSQAQRSTMGSLISFAGALVSGVGSILAGVLADHFGPSQSLTIILLLTLPTALVYFRLYRDNKAIV